VARFASSVALSLTLGGLELDHRRFAREQRPGVRVDPGGEAVHQQPRRLQFGRELREPVLQGLEAPDRPVELPSLLNVRQHVVERALAPSPAPARR
jgi:hypothetical protein